MGTEAQKYWRWNLESDIDTQMLHSSVMGWTYYHLGLVDRRWNAFVVFTHAMVDLCQVLVNVVDNARDNLPPTNKPKNAQENV